MKKVIITLTILLISKIILAQSNLEKIFTDEFNISGIYYLSKPVEIFAKQVSVVNFEFIPESYKLNMYYDEKDTPEKIAMNATFKQHYKTCGVFFENSKNYLGGRIIQLETGLFIALAGESNAYVSNGSCDNFIFTDPKNEILVLGKNKARVKEVASDIELLKKLTEESCIKYCGALKCVLSGKYPFPEPGMKDTKLSNEALTVVRSHATTAGWTQKIEYCYVKSKDWTIITNKLTNTIVARTIRLIAVMKNTNGSCQWEEVEVKQDFNGSTYGKTYFSGNTQQIITLDCLEAMKYK